METIVKSRPRIPQSLRELVRQRGQRAHNLWVCYAHKLKRDVYLSSDYALCHLVLLECDSQVAKYVLEAPELTTLVHGKEVTTRFDATVIYQDGHQEWHEVKSQVDPDNQHESRQLAAQRQLAIAHATQYRLFTDADFKGKTQRVWNGLFMLSTLAAARTYSLLPYRNAILTKLKGDDYLIQDLLDVVDGDRGLILAALFELHMQGHVALEVDAKPISVLHRCRYVEVSYAH